ncbi:cyanophycinase [Tundrisphaera lichenicola]|uniref:cyanophycinase n=1 Tax=Tundrisphaera lichenicola TaxID=2029860 RepID=UPI003EB8FBD3
MRASWKSAFFCLALAAFPSISTADEGPVLGSLVIVGGGGMPDEVRDKFVALAGGEASKIVVIPTASADADVEAERESFLKPWRKYRPAGLGLLHTRSREKADDPAFARPIAEASAVWLGGGDQTRLIAAYRGTSVDRELRALLARGGVIGGTSAGAAVMSGVMIEGGNPVAEVGPGFGFVTNAVVDQHFLKRSRLNRLLGVLADRPGLIGIGIDEGTAFVLENDRWSVLGRSYVVACEPGRDGQPPRFETFSQGDHGTYPAAGLPTPAARRPED